MPVARVSASVSRRTASFGVEGVSCSSPRPITASMISGSASRGGPGRARPHEAATSTRVRSRREAAVALDLVEADRREPDSSGDHRGFSGLSHEVTEDRVGEADELLARDVRSAADHEALAQEVSTIAPIDETECGQGAEVAVDRGCRRVEEDGQTSARTSPRSARQSAGPESARKRGVLVGLLWRPVAGGRWRFHRTTVVGSRSVPDAPGADISVNAPRRTSATSGSMSRTESLSRRTARPCGRP